MRILHLVHQYPPDHVGGTEVYTQTLAMAQVRRGNEVAVFAPAPRPRDAMAEPALEEGVRVFRVPVGRRSGTAVFRSTFGAAGLTTALEAVLDDFRPAVVHVEHLMGLPADAAHQLVARGIPFVIALHDYWYGCANAQLLTNYDQTICAGPNATASNCGRCALARAGLPGGASLAVAPIMRRRNRLLAAVVASAARVIAPNRFVADTIRQLGLPVGRLAVVPWGMDLPDGLAAIRAEAAAARAAEPPGPLRLGYIGSLSHQKGIHVLVDAVNALPEDSVTLDIYGNPAVFPTYVDSVRRSATHPDIHFRGHLPRPDFWPRLAALDALVLPTLWYEASPLTIDEAFAAGTPVIGSDIGALPAMIRDGVDGRLFPPGDAAGLARLLGSLAGDPSAVATLRAGIQPVKTMDNHAAEIEDLYRHLNESDEP